VSGRRGFRREVVALADDAIGLVGLGDQELALGAAQLVLRAAGVNAELTRTQFLHSHRRLSQVVGCHEAVVHRVVLENKNDFQMLDFAYKTEELVLSDVLPTLLFKLNELGFQLDDKIAHQIL
jgi:hypothetical protein